MNEKRNVVAFFYERLDKVATKIIASLTKVEDHFAGQDLVFINIDINEVKDISVTAAPSIVYFKNGEPEPYTGKFYFLLELFQNTVNAHNSSLQISVFWNKEPLKGPNDTKLIVNESS